MSRAEFEFSVPAEHPSLAGHFPGNPVVPGVLLLDHVLHALERSTGRSVTRLRQVKFVSILLPGELAHGYWDVEDSRAAFRVSARRGGSDVTVAEGAGILCAKVIG
jgi:3-hydroxymyristoyl/3-hydroxydecanoyl-(acyl carrier protein) dehydratase